MNEVWGRVEGADPVASDTQIKLRENIIVEEINDLGGLDGLRDAWTGLLNGSPSDSIFMTWEWQRSWWKHLARHCVRRFLVVRRSGRIIGIAPLVIAPRRMRRLLPFRAMEFAGKGAIGPDYLDLISRGREETTVVEALCDCLAPSPHVIVLDQVAAGPTPTLRLARSLESRGWAVGCRFRGVCPNIPLEGETWESYLSHLGASHRQNIRRRLRKIKRDFAMQLVVAETEEQRRQCLHEFQHLHQMRWGPRGGSSALTGPEVMRFHDEFSRLALKRGWLRLSVLRLDDHPVACIYGFLYHDVFYFYQTGFNPDFARYSVGLVAIALSIQRAIAEGAHCYDMLHGGEQYKYLWTHAERNLVAYDCYPPTVHGKLAHHLVKTRSSAKGAMLKVFGSAQTEASFVGIGAEGH